MRKRKRKKLKEKSSRDRKRVQQILRISTCESDLLGWETEKRVECAFETLSTFGQLINDCAIKRVRRTIAHSNNDQNGIDIFVYLSEDKVLRVQVQHSERNGDRHYYEEKGICLVVAPSNWGPNRTLKNVLRTVNAFLRKYPDALN